MTRVFQSFVEVGKARSIVFIIKGCNLRRTGACCDMILAMGFRPFAGRMRNGSETLAAHLGGSEVGGHAVVSVFLDVFWGAPKGELPRWIAEVRPVLVLGIGEGQGDVLRFERRARNRAAGCDESGAPPPFAPELRPGGHAEMEASMGFDPAWVADLAPSELSEDAGKFLCNAWLYAAIELCPCPVGFIHIPVQGDVSDGDFIARWAPAVREILRRNLPL